MSRRRGHKHPSKQERLGSLTATEALALFDDLPDGAAFAAAASSLGIDDDDFVDQLAAEQEGPGNDA